MMAIIGMLCPHCDDELMSEGFHHHSALWLGNVDFVLCEPCQRFFYILSDDDNYPVTVIDAEHGMGPGDPGYSFDPARNGSIDLDDPYWHDRERLS